MKEDIKWMMEFEDCGVIFAIIFVLQNKWWRWRLKRKGINITATTTTISSSKQSNEK